MISYFSFVSNLYSITLHYLFFSTDQCHESGGVSGKIMIEMNSSFIQFKSGIRQ